jgi:regulatory protein
MLGKPGGLMHLPKPSPEHGEEIALARARQSALRSLARRPRTEAQVKRLLEGRYSPLIVQQVIGQLREQRYLDDAAFAQEWRRHREQHRPRGSRLIRHELLRVGVAPEIIQAALEGYDAEGQAYRAGRGPALRLAGSGYRDFRQRLWAYLRRRGFDHSAIQEAVKQLWRDLPDFLNGGVDPHGDNK